MKTFYKKLACMFIPKQKIRFLLIGESPPFTLPNEELKFFYNYKNTMGGQMLLSNVSYSFLGQKFYVDRDNKRDFLNKLANKGVFLIDSVYEPINQINNMKLRRDKIINQYPQLKRNISTLALEDGAGILVIHNNVNKAIGHKLEADLRKSGYRVFYIGFPRYYNDERFKTRIKSAIAKLKAPGVPSVRR